MKCCNYCKVTKPLEMFINDRDKKDGKQTYCRECRAISKHNAYEKQKEKLVKQSSIGMGIKRVMLNPKSNSKYFKYTGCSKDFFRKWIEHQFSSDMNFGNHGKIWDMEHLKPLKSFDTINNPDMLYEAWNWKNLQPLSHLDNMLKGIKRNKQQEENQKTKAIYFESFYYNPESFIYLM